MNIEIYCRDGGMVAPFIYLIKNPSSLQQCPKIYTVTDSLFKIAFKCIQWLSASAKCTSQNYTDSPKILCDAPCCENSCE